MSMELDTTYVILSILLIYYCTHSMIMTISIFTHFSVYSDNGCPFMFPDMCGSKQTNPKAKGEVCLRCHNSWATGYKVKSLIVGNYFS